MKDFLDYRTILHSLQTKDAFLWTLRKCKTPKGVSCSITRLYYLLYNLWHPVFLITANTVKILTRLWQLFSNLLDARNPKIWLKLKFNEPFLSYQLHSTANSALWAALFWAVLLCPQKGLVRFQFKWYFWISCIK